MIMLDSSIVLDALSHHVAVIDQQGNLIQVNRTWQEFARANGDPTLAHTGVGTNYLEACRRAQGKFSEEALPALAGILQILDGSRDFFEMEYFCPSHKGNLWFVMRVTPLRDAILNGAVISHTNVTERHLARVEQTDLEHQAEREREHATLALLSGNSPVSITAQSFGLGALSASAPEKFAAFAQRYETILHRAVESRVYRVDHPIANDLRDLANDLGFLNAGPRDVVQIHADVLSSIMRGTSPAQAHLMNDEARLRALELMGYLTSFYRQRAGTLRATARWQS